MARHAGVHLPARGLRVHRVVPMTDAGRTVGDVIASAAGRLEAADLAYGHGTDNPLDDAAEIVFFAAGLRHEDAPGVYALVLDPAVRAAAERLIERRITGRVPTAYLTRRMWFAGHEFYVDERVLVPRSPIAELIDGRFAPWLNPGEVRRIVDIGTGSGCIATAAALAFPEARVDAADISPAALEVTGINIGRHGVGGRVRPVLADVYAGLGDGRYDLIVSNPPYVSSAEMEALADEYRHEPALGLHAGDDGLDIVRRILAGAGERLTPHGILVVEVGDSEVALAAACPRVPFTWLEFERGGGGVFLLTAADLAANREPLQAFGAGR